MSKMSPGDAEGNREAVSPDRRGGPDPERRERFRQLVQRAQDCRRCLRMEGRVRVLSPANGSIHASVLFIAEAPGRLGADRFAIPLYGDQTGRNFEVFLSAAGLRRDAIFVTNAVLCNPRDDQGRNAAPAQREIANCAGHLGATIALIDPRYVVTLGAVALRALQHIAPHDLRLRRDVGRVVPWHGRRLVPLYHPGPRALIHRPLSVQLQDYQRLGALVCAEGS